MAYSDDNTPAENIATMPMNEIGPALWNKTEDWYKYVRENGMLTIWISSYQQYYKGFVTRGQAQKRGLANQLTKVNVNHYRNMILHVVNMITAQRPAFDPRAVNSDFKSYAQTILAKGILDHYMDMGLENYLKIAAEYAYFLGEGYLVIEWDSTIGEDVAPEDELDEEGEPKKEKNPKIVKSGDIRYYNATPLDVVRDFNARSYDECDWHIVRTFVNKYELGAQYEEHKDDIEAIVYQRDIERDFYILNTQSTQGDKIPIYTYYHKPTLLVPDGRRVQFVAADIVLNDGPLVGKDYPLKRMSPSEMADTPFGYSAAFDLLELQKNYDSLGSSITTNQEMFGTQMLSVEKGSTQSVEDFGGMQLHERTPGSPAPEPLQLTSTAPEIFTYQGTVETNMEKIMGINAVVRGDPKASLESGSALALVLQTALQFNNGGEQSFNQLIEDCGASIIKLTQTYATTTRVAIITGKANKWYKEEYKGADIDQIERVKVDRGNPMAKTTAGKIQIAQDLFNMGLIKTPEQYIQVLETGKLEPIIEGEQAELMLIKDENEQLSDGKEMQAAWTDAHAIHIKEHKVVMASVDARNDEALMAATLAHLTQHLKFLRETDPQQLMMVGEQGMQPPAPEEGAPGGDLGTDPLTNSMNMAAQETPDLPEIPEPAQAPPMEIIQ